MTPLSLAEVARMCGGELAGGVDDAKCGGVSIDSRSISAGELFVAIRGERFDGHSFVPDVLSRGAAGAVVDRRYAEAVGDERDGLVVVRDTIHALGRLAHAYRRECLPATTRVVAITGSNGKTTTKRMLHHILSGAIDGVSSPRSFNNDIGVPLTLLSAGAQDGYVITEVGTNAPGEIAHLSRMCEPDVAVVTSVSEAHLEGLVSVEGVAREKLSLLDGLRSAGAALICNEREEARAELVRRSDSRVVSFGRCGEAGVAVRNVASDGASVSFDLGGAIDIDDVRVPIGGAHHALNAAAAIWAAAQMGVSPEVARDRLGEFEAAAGRAARREVGGVTLVDDTYNANPESMRGAVRSLAEMSASRRVFVMGDMGELGSASEGLHQDCVRFAADSGVDVVVAAGALVSRAASSLNSSSPGGADVWVEGEPDLLAVKLGDWLSAGDAVWLKASRAARMEQLVAALEDRLRKRFALQSSASIRTERSTAPQPANP